MKRLMTLIGALVLSLAAAATLPPASAQESQLDVVLKRDKLIVGTYSTSPPLAYIDDSGNLVGFEIDLAHQIAKDLLGDPNKVEFVVMQSDGRFPAALSGKIDMGMCSTTITPDRAIRIAFTYPYIDSGSVLLARKDANVTKITQLNDPKYTYAILNVPPAIARTKEVLPKIQQLLLDSPSALFLAVKTGRATVFSIDKPIADYYAAENSDLVPRRYHRHRAGLCQQRFVLSEAGRLQVVVVPRYLCAGTAFRHAL